MDNKVFNVNGGLHRENHRRDKDIDQLARALELVMRQHGENTKAVGWTVVPSHGLVLHWTDPKDNVPKGCTFHKFIAPLEIGDSHTLAHTVARWIEGEGVTLAHDGWDKEYTGDGDCGDGWRIYVEDWGHVAGLWSAICGVRHAYMWYGK